MKFRSFDSKTKNAELDAFDILIHYTHMLDIMYEKALAAGDMENMLQIVDKMLEANDRYLTVILGLENEEPQNNEPAVNSGFGFTTHEPPQVDSISTPNSEPGEL